MELVGVGVGVGAKLRPQHRDNRYVLDFATREEVAKAHELAHQHAETYDIELIEPLIDTEDTYSFVLRDLDENWWELKHNARQIVDDAYNQPK